MAEDAQRIKFVSGLVSMYLSQNTSSSLSGLTTLAAVVLAAVMTKTIFPLAVIAFDIDVGYRRASRSSWAWRSCTWTIASSSSSQPTSVACRSSRCWNFETISYKRSPSPWGVSPSFPGLISEATFSKIGYVAWTEQTMSSICCRRPVHPHPLNRDGCAFASEHQTISKSCVGSLSTVTSAKATTCCNFPV